MSIHVWGLEQMEFSGHRRVLGHRLAGGRLAAPYIHGDPFG